MKDKFPPQINETPEWKKLEKLALKNLTLGNLFSDNPARFRDFSVQTEHIFCDFSRQIINNEILKGLVALAEAASLKAKISSMFKGEKINLTEGRAVGHWALRVPAGKPAVIDGKDMSKDIQEVLGRISAFTKKVHSEKRIRNIVSIGIGGSSLGPEYLAEACRPYARNGMKLAFVANVDGTDFAIKTSGLDPAETLFVIVSKTFTTAETMKNAETAKDWILNNLDGNKEDLIKKHFIAVSTARDKVEAFGIDPENMFTFWEWVGGRFSATSAVGAAPLSFYLGHENFEKILEGARWMDQHFLKAPLDKNIPVIGALIDIWNINFLGLKTRALLPYSQLLWKIAQHTQQVEMESNGKGVDIHGRKVEFDTGEVVFGEPGTNGQHSFYQELHQGQVIPADFIGFIKPAYPLGNMTDKQVDHHHELMTNFLAQPDALAFGKVSDDPARTFEGNRPSSSMLLKELNPFTAGALLAWLEHRAAAKGFMWDINSFDQFGVEHGKKLGVAAREAMLGDKSRIDAFNPSTRRMFDAIMNGELPS